MNVATHLRNHALSESGMYVGPFQIIGRRRCQHCGGVEWDKGRDRDGRRAYRCRGCRVVHTSGMQGRRPRFSPQRPSFQFADTGAARLSDVMMALARSADW